LLAKAFTTIRALTIPRRFLPAAGTHDVRSVLMLGLWAGVAAADGRLIDDDTFAVTSQGRITIDGGLVVATTSALPSGLAAGAGAAVTRDCTCWLSYGASLAVTTITESQMAWTVTHDDFRVRVFGALRHAVGRGNVALRLGVGPSIVHEHRTRNEAVPGSGLDTTANAMLPALDLEGMFVVHVMGPWLAVIEAGPALDRFDGALRTGWIAGLGIGWQP
jgi:hypothetical protein